MKSWILSIPQVITLIAMDAQIVNAIENRQLLRFTYDGGERVVEVHCYGRTSKGNDAIHAYQVRGYSSTGRMGWKLFTLAEASSMQLLEETFDGPRPDYKTGDKAMISIY